MHHHPGSHDPVLVALSVLIAALSSYTALDLATRMRAASGSASLGWLAAAAVAMGGGIWSMHFIAMLAFETPLERGYDLGLTVLSALVAIGVVAIGLWIVRERLSVLRLSIAGAIVSLAHALGLEITAAMNDLDDKDLLPAHRVFTAMIEAMSAETPSESELPSRRQSRELGP